jgi:hypothetical protein
MQYSYEYSSISDNYPEPAMKRLLTLWLTLLGAFWLTRAAVSALLFERIADRGGEALFLLVAVPLLQAALVGWLTRPPAGDPQA